MADKKQQSSLQPTCGIIMPISLIENCPPEHWAEVLNIIKEVCDSNGFSSNLVSDAEDAGIIHNRIIENIYSSDIVICDVSCKNSNVMFELGMRLAFDRPTIIIKDDLTGYSFDTSMIEHVEYRRDLRFTSINKFKEVLGNKLKATYEKSQAEPTYSPFLKNFGKYKIAHLEDREITSDKYILNAIEDLKRDVRVIRNNAVHYTNDHIKPNNSNSSMNYSDLERIDITKIMLRNMVEKYLKTNVNPGAPLDPDVIVPEIVKLVEKDITLKVFFNDRNRLEQIIMDLIYLQ